MKVFYRIPLSNTVASRDMWLFKFKLFGGGLRGGAVVKNPPANAGDMGSSPGPGRSHMLWSN